MSGNDDHTTGNLLDYLYHQKYCKLTGISLSSIVFCLQPVMKIILMKMLMLIILFLLSNTN